MSVECPSTAHGLLWACIWTLHGSMPLAAHACACLANHHSPSPLRCCSYRAAAEGILAVEAYHAVGMPVLLGGMIDAELLALGLGPCCMKLQSLPCSTPAYACVVSPPLCSSPLQGAVRLALHNAGNKDTGYGVNVRKLISMIAKTRDAIDCKKYTKQVRCTSESCPPLADAKRQADAFG